VRPIEELGTLGHTIVEYALQSSRSPTGAATCQTVRELPRGLRDQFPGLEGIARLLEGRGMKVVDFDWSVWPAGPLRKISGEVVT